MSRRAFPPRGAVRGSDRHRTRPICAPGKPGHPRPRRAVSAPLQPARRVQFPQLVRVPASPPAPAPRGGSQPRPPPLRSAAPLAWWDGKRRTRRPAAAWWSIGRDGLVALVPGKCPARYLVSAGLVQQLIDPQCTGLRDAPGVHRLAAHPVLEVPLTLYHEYPCTMFGHCLGEGRAA